MEFVEATCSRKRVRLKSSIDGYRIVGNDTLIYVRKPHLRRMPDQRGQFLV